MAGVLQLRQQASKRAHRDQEGKERAGEQIKGSCTVGLLCECTSICLSIQGHLVEQSKILPSVHRVVALLFVYSNTVFTRYDTVHLPRSRCFADFCSANLLYFFFLNIELCSAS